MLHHLIVFLSGYVSNDLDFSDVSEPQQLEFSDPLNEWESWIKSIYSLDYFENNITSEIEVSYADATFQLGTDEISFPPVEGEHIYSFKIIDPRFTELALLHPDQWEASMTTTAIQTITLIKTLPKFSYQDKSDEKEFEIQEILLNQLLHGISASDLDGNTENEFTDKGGAISLVEVKDSEGISLVDFNELFWILKIKNIHSTTRYLIIAE